MSFPPIPVIPIILASYLALHGLRKRSLSPSGAIAAFIVGASMLAMPLRAFGVSLILFYLTGSQATKRGAERKAQLEDAHQSAGYRDAYQVLCNSASALAAALVWGAMYVPGAQAGLGRFLRSAEIVQLRRPYDFEEWCPLDVASDGDRWSRVLLFVTLGHFACCLGDTLASELGILSSSPPRLITTFKPVPPGTNGAMSKAGTLASLFGGFFMGLVLAFSLLIQSSACRTNWPTLLFTLAGWGTIAGGLGSLLDSVMGATIQRTRFSTISSRVLTDESAEPQSGADIKVISGLNILTNNQVNLVSSILTAVSLGLAA